MKLSIVIPAHNEEEYIGKCLDSLGRAMLGDPRLLEIIVVDNVSTDKTAEVAARYPNTLVLRENKKGVNHARERGRSMARGDLIAFIDADTIVGFEWIDKIYEHFLKKDDLVCLSGPAYLDNLAPHEDLLNETYWSMAAPVSKATGYMVVGSNLVAKKEALNQIDGFNTDIPFYGDDTDLGRRISKVGKVIFDKNFMVYTSDRRLRGDGVVKTLALYVSNYFSVVVLKKPISKRYNDIR